MFVIHSFTLSTADLKDSGLLCLERRGTPTRKADYGECLYTATPIQAFSCHIESCATCSPKYALRICVVFMSESLNVLVAIFFSYQDKDNTKAREWKVVKTVLLSIKLVKQL